MKALAAILLVPFAQAFAGDPSAVRETVADLQLPERVFTNETGGIVVDFGKDAFGWLEIDAPAAGCEYFMNVGEILREKNGGYVSRKPGENVRARGVKWHTERAGFQRVPIAPDLRNLFVSGEGSPARLPEKYGVVTPFRAVEFYRADFPVSAKTVRRFVVSYPADRTESSFACDDERLVRVYDFCKYSMFATSFAGMFVDGDRERIPYEADAYAAQLSWYAVSSDYAYPRKTIEYLYDHPTWPTEFKQASVMSAWADWMWTGDARSIAKHYDTLKGEKMLLGHVRESDGLLVSGGERLPWPCYTNRCGLSDIVDWPRTERASFDFRDVNVVVNAFHVRTLEYMRDMAETLGKAADAEDFAARSIRARASYAKVFADPATGLVVDGEGSSHSSVQANAIALAFGLVPPENVDRVADWLVTQGMGCSVYFAQYLLEGLFRAGRADAAFALLTADDDRSWLGMLAQDATMTMEAWNMKVKPNQDFNHAWGATALNVISRFVLGVTPLEPGFRKISVRPNFGPLKRVSATVPTQAGPVRIEFADGRLSVASPAPAAVSWKGCTAELPGDGALREAVRWQEPNYDESKVAPYALEDPLTFLDGRKVAAEDWPERRREILGIFAKEMYGQEPPQPEAVVTELRESGVTFGEMAVREQVRMWFRPDRTGPHIDWLIVRPRYAKGPVPVIAMLNYYGNHAQLSDSEMFMPEPTSWMQNEQLSVGAITNHQSQAACRGFRRRSDSRSICPVEMLLAHGYAFVTACYADVSPDPDWKTDDMEKLPYTGIFELWGLRDPARTDDITALGAWAWALSRAVDYAEKTPELDAKRVVVTGCSRLGKAALLAAARDERFAVCVPNQTGGGGVPLAKRNYGENVATEMIQFPHWYCKAYAKYAADPAKTLTFDQHLLLACVAPRALLVEGYDGRWFDAKGEFLSVQAASPVWKLLAGEPTAFAAMPDDFDESAIGRNLGYVRRPGRHGYTYHDWQWLLDFADRHVRRGRTDKR